MHLIKEIIQKENPSFDELICCFEKIKENGDIAAIKFDGQRDTDHYTVFITFPGNKRDMIRADGADLKKSLVKVMTS